MSSAVVRADAGPAIGDGHLMRCLTLAEALAEQGVRATFALTRPAERHAARIRAAGADLRALESDIAGSAADAEATATIVVELGARIVVVDGYHFDAAFTRRLRGDRRSVVVIDDLADRELDADVVLNANLFAPELQYGPAAGSLLIGIDYALVRGEIVEARGRRSPTRGSADARRALVTMGGADPTAETSKVLDALELVRDRALDVQIVAGPSNPRLTELREAAARAAPHTVTVLHDVTRMGELMAGSDIAISAAGSTCAELACVGTPSLVIPVADNQRPVARAFAERRLARSLGWHADVAPSDIARALRDLLDDAAARRVMTEAAMTAIDGSGARRAARALIAKLA